MRLRKKDAFAMGRGRDLVGPDAPQMPYVQEPCATDPESSSIAPTMLSPYYLTIPRGPDLVSASKNISSLLNVNDILVDSNGDLTTSLEIPQVYEGDLMHDDLTEDDRRLAAALVAVQLVNQQKHQSGNQNIMPIMPSNSMAVGSKIIGSSEAGLESLSTLDGGIEVKEELLSEGLSYQAAAPEVDGGTFLHPLSPLKKALSRSRYFQNDQTASPIALEISDMDIASSATLATTEHIDFMLADDAKDQFETDNDMETDYDEMEDLHRQTLPHKKRIAKRLRKQKKPRSSSQNPEQTYTCELCSDEFANQWKFFEHLKSHYESNDKQQYSRMKRPEDYPILNKTLRLRGKGGKAQTETVPTSMPRLNPISKSPPQKNFDAAKGPLKVKTYFEQTNQVSTSTAAETSPTFPCSDCKVSFRRPKMLEVHMATVHPRQEVVEEFSEPEDMMEGIRLRVDSEDDESELKETGHGKPWSQGGIYSSHVAMTEEQLKEDKEFQEEVKHTEAVLGTLEVNIKDMRSLCKQEEQQFSVAEAAGSKKNNSRRRMRKTADPKEAISCDICNVDFETREEASIHINEEHSAVVASVTKRSFNKKVKHVKKKVRKKEMSCGQCGRKFGHRNSLIYHEKSHVGERDFQCHDCGKAFFARSALVVHMRLHTNTKPYKCEFCSRNFRQFGDLKYHVISIHSNKKDYQCEYCGKSFARKYSLTVHNRIHTGEKNYKCDYCDKSFRAATYLQNHRRIHTGEKPYKCDNCLRLFRVRSDLVRHMTTHHDKKQVKEEIVAAVDSLSTKNEEIVETVTEVVHAQRIGLPEGCKIEILEATPLESYQLLDSRLTTVTSLPGSNPENVEASRGTGTLYLWQVFPT